MSFALRCVTAAEEQAWNDRQLATPVTAPRLAFWTYRDTAVVVGRSQRHGAGTDCPAAFRSPFDGLRASGTLDGGCPFPLALSPAKHERALLPPPASPFLLTLSPPKHEGALLAPPASPFPLMLSPSQHERALFPPPASPFPLMLSLSKHERALSRTPARVPIVHRRSGGGAVLVGPEVLGVSVLLPLEHPFAVSGLVSSYEWFGCAHARALRRLGVLCEAVSPKALPRAAADPIAAWACFGAVSPWEVVTLTGRRKLVGLAQRRTRTGVLLVSGTLIEDQRWDVLCDALGQSVEAAAILRGSTSSCRRELGKSIAVADVARRVARELDVALRFEMPPGAQGEP